jgi:hypothetical protein
MDFILEIVSTVVSLKKDNDVGYLNGSYGQAVRIRAR